MTASEQDSPQRTRAAALADVKRRGPIIRPTGRPRPPTLRECNEPPSNCWPSRMIAEPRTPARVRPTWPPVAGNSPVYSHGCKSPLPVAEGVAGKPSCKASGRKPYFRYSSQGCGEMTLYGYARVSVREPEDKNWTCRWSGWSAPAAPWAIFEPRRPAGPRTTAAASWNCCQS